MQTAVGLVKDIVIEIMWYILHGRSLGWVFNLNMDSFLPSLFTSTNMGNFVHYNDMKQMKYIF